MFLFTLQALTLMPVPADSRDTQVQHHENPFIIFGEIGTYQRCCPLKVHWLSTGTHCTASCCSWATRGWKGQHLDLRLVVVAPAPNRGFSR